MEQQQQEKFDSWAIVELMGHRRIAGRVSEQAIGGASLLRIDVPECPEIPAHEVERWGARHVVPAQPEIPAYTQFYGVASVYCLTPTTEEIARRVTQQQRERPVALFDASAVRTAQTLSLPTAPADSENSDDDLEEEEDS
jgi:hypothetical protein